ncbi:MAG TPA: hypothetical protein DCY13_05735 [Verrucomicrobiales bacterium]|jgi:hypothetical protein|nr:hypothetical protein [Verrucomicrobiales bacterium]
MQVNPSHHQEPVRQTEMVRSRATTAQVVGDGASFDRSAALNRSLAEVPDTRSEVVARARRLIEDPKYPPTEAISKIADLLAMHIEREQATGESK